MSDIFLSYASVDLQRVRPFIQALERRGWMVWWDRTILPGKTYDQVIEEALEAARCVLVVWSQASIASAWVRAEADEGRQRAILVPVMIDAGVRLPLAFRQIQAANLVGWRGEEAHPEFTKVVQALTGLLGAAPGQLVLEPEVAAQSDLQVEPPGIADVGSTPQPPPAPPPIQRESYPEPLPGRERRTVSGKKSVVWGIVAVLLLALPILYKVIHSPAENSSAPSTNRQAVAEPTVKNSIGMEFVLIKAGEFQMGSADGYENEIPVHTVRISQPFYLGKYEVTQEQWQAVMKNNPSSFTGDGTRPVEQVSWDDVQKFIDALNKQEGGSRYLLPTEAEWEYAARAGRTTAYSFGDEAKQLPKYAWYSDNSKNQTHPVGKREPNPWGLYDMHGNVWEWVQDWYGAYSAEAAEDPQGPSTGAGRVNRGGGWGSGAGYCRSAYRGGARPGNRSGGVGFRLLRTAS